MDNDIFKLWFLDINLKKDKKISILKNGISPEAFYKMSLKDYLEWDINIIEAERINSSKNIDIYKEIISYLYKEKIDLVLYNDCDYPDILKDIPNPPVGLFIKGKMPDFNYSLAVVGTRRATEYGKTVSYKLSYDSALKGIVIISGMARGIDTCAHKGALDAKGITVAVMGSGFKYIYPAENKKLMCEIAERGCVISEYLPDVKPFSSNFPERNRIISGLSKNTLVVEAGIKSGALITAEFALEQGRDVFAVPGNIFSPYSNGTNKLIKDGAKIITDIEDIFEEYEIKNKITINFELDDFESLVLDNFKTNGITIEQLCNILNIDASTLLSTLCKLECKGIIKKAYGNYFIKCIT